MYILCVTYSIQYNIYCILFIQYTVHYIMCYIQYTVYTVYILCVTSSILLLIDINVMCSFLSCSVLFCATRCYAVTSCWILRHHMLCYATCYALCYAIQRNAFHPFALYSLPHHMLRHAMLCYATMLCYPTLRAMLCYPMLRYGVCLTGRGGRGRTPGYWRRAREEGECPRPPDTMRGP